MCIPAPLLERVHRAGRHHIAGTIARYVVQSRDRPEEVQILLVWRQAVLPGRGAQEQALAALRADLATVLIWEEDSLIQQEGVVLLHT